MMTNNLKEIYENMNFSSNSLLTEGGIEKEDWEDLTGTNEEFIRDEEYYKVKDCLEKLLSHSIDIPEELSSLIEDAFKNISYREQIIPEIISKITDVLNKKEK